jgi:hypothetical protein
VTTESENPEDPQTPQESLTAGEVLFGHVITEPGHERRAIRVSMGLSSRSILQADFVKEYLDLPTKADAVAVALDVTAQLLEEQRKGSEVFVESKSGVRSRLTINRRS